ncbi:hypothetical protein AAW00_12620 [Aurantiacibacter luteus]|uniref:Uncharacterized protein n=1 Tax=Aurantiacibacter luteus TaxID=1581420 RepID=A0A0G9MXF3_9SPHN|nr:hypothetical protein AAW00_12620 [Aurantiacibacter luteus]
MGPRRGNLRDRRADAGQCADDPLAHPAARRHSAGRLPVPERAVDHDAHRTLHRHNPAHRAPSPLRGR